MGVFKPTPTPLEYGEPVHVMMARAFMYDAIKLSGDIMVEAKYHFVGPHGIAYQGKRNLWRDKSTPHGIARLCEEIQSDFNERTAAMTKAREYAREKLEVPPLFVSANDEEE